MIGDEVTVTPLRLEDAEAIVAAEDEATRRWLTGGRSTLETTRDHVLRLDAAAARGSTKRAFAMRVDGAVVGSIDFDADPQDGIGPGDVNISYALAPWMRGRGVTARVVELLCGIMHDRRVGHRAVIRCDPRNLPSARVAQKAGFRFSREILSTTNADEHGEPVTLSVYVREL